MSALAQDRQPRDRRRERLRPVPSRPTVIGRVPFLLILASVLVVGMVGVLVLNTSLQSRAFEVRKLQRQASELAYLRADLEATSRHLATTEELARRATGLGMVPNPYPVYLVVPTGEVRGVPKPVTGAEVPLIGYKSPAEVAAARQTATTPLPEPEPVTPAEPGDGVAPQSGVQQ